MLKKLLKSKKKKKKTESNLSEETKVEKKRSLPQKIEKNKKEKSLQNDPSKVLTAEGWIRRQKKT